MRNLQELARDERGATAIEYGLILTLIFLAMIVAVTAFGQETIKMWTEVAQKVDSARD